MLTTPTKPKPPALLHLGAEMLREITDPTPERYIPSGIKGLDSVILGAIPSEIVVIGGGPGMGKTSLAVQWLVHTAQTIGPTALLSLEMGRRAIGQRLVAGLTGIDLRILRTKQWESPAQQENAIAAAQYLSEIPLYIDARSGLSAESVYETLLYWKREGIVLAGIDYLQRIKGTNDSRTALVGDSVQAVKSGAKDADLPVLLLSSLNRGVNSREDKAPRMSDLRDSGDIEFEADTILMFSYPNGNKDKEMPSREGYVHVLKQRNGGTGDVPVWFQQTKYSFTDRKG